MAATEFDICVIGAGSGGLVVAAGGATLGAKVALIEKAVQRGTRLRLVGQVRPSSWEDERGQKRYSIEFVVTGFGEVEILARGKPKAEAASEEAPAGEEAPKAKRRRAA